MNDICVALDMKQSCAALFIDLSKAFDTVDHALLKQRLLNVGLFDQAVHGFGNNQEGPKCVEGNSSV